MKQLQALHDWKNMGAWTLSYHFPQFQEIQFVSNRKLGNHLFPLSCYYLFKVNICSRLLFSTRLPNTTFISFQRTQFLRTNTAGNTKRLMLCIASWKMYNLTINSSTKVRVRKSLNCKVWSGLNKVAWSTFQVPETQIVRKGGNHIGYNQIP